MSQPTPQILQTYTLLQIAAEAFLGRNREAPAARPGEVTEFQFDVTALMEGNGHSTRMTQKQAEQFAREWKVISHQPNTATGFEQLGGRSSGVRSRLSPWEHVLGESRDLVSSPRRSR